MLPLCLIMDAGLQKEEESKKYKLNKLIMARYIGPKSKISRKFGEPIFGADKDHYSSLREIPFWK